MPEEAGGKALKHSELPKAGGRRERGAEHLFRFGEQRLSG